MASSSSALITKCSNANEVHQMSIRRNHIHDYTVILIIVCYFSFWLSLKSALAVLLSDLMGGCSGELWWAVWLFTSALICCHTNFSLQYLSLLIHRKGCRWSNRVASKYLEAATNTNMVRLLLFICLIFNEVIRLFSHILFWFTTPPIELHGFCWQWGVRRRLVGSRVFGCVRFSWK